MRLNLIKYFLILFFCNNIYSQNCIAPDSLSTQDSISTLNYAFVSLRWNAVLNIDNYRIRFKKLSDTKIFD